MIILRDIVLLALALFGFRGWIRSIFVSLSGETAAAPSLIAVFVTCLIASTFIYFAYKVIL